MAIKSITEGMTAEQVSGLLDGNFAEVQKGVNEAKGAVGTEELRARAAEEANAEAIGAEVERAEAAEVAEAERAQEAERALDGRITEVQQGSNAAIEALAQYAGEIDGNVAAEKERAQAAEMENRQKIEAEVARAKAAEEANAEAIGDEVARAKEAEASLTEDVGVISGDLEKEIQRAQAAEQALGTEITEAENRVDERVTEVRDSLEAEVQARSVAVADLNANTGISEYPAFDPAVDYAVGDVVNYEGRLRRFVADHAAGEWIGTDAENWSERKEVNKIYNNFRLYAPIIEFSVDYTEKTVSIGKGCRCSTLYDRFTVIGGNSYISQNGFTVDISDIIDLGVRTYACIVVLVKSNHSDESPAMIAIGMVGSVDNREFLKQKLHEGYYILAIIRNERNTYIDILAPYYYVDEVKIQNVVSLENYVTKSLLEKELRDDLSSLSVLFNEVVCYNDTNPCFTIDFNRNTFSINKALKMYTVDGMYVQTVTLDTHPWWDKSIEFPDTTSYWYYVLVKLEDIVLVTKDNLSTYIDNGYKFVCEIRRSTAKGKGYVLGNINSYSYNGEIVYTSFSEANFYDWLKKYQGEINAKTAETAKIANKSYTSFNGDKYEETEYPAVLGAVASVGSYVDTDGEYSLDASIEYVAGFGNTLMKVSLPEEAEYYIGAAVVGGGYDPNKQPTFRLTGGDVRDVVIHLDKTVAVGDRFVRINIVSARARNEGEDILYPSRIYFYGDTTSAYNFHIYDIKSWAISNITEDDFSDIVEAIVISVKKGQPLTYSTFSSGVLTADKVKNIDTDTIGEAVIEELGIQRVPGIVCWGSSSTAGGGWVNELANLTELKTFNGGVGGEGLYTILGRIGSEPMRLNQSITIPADKTPIQLGTGAGPSSSIMYVLGNKVTPLLQGDGLLNPVIIAGVKGTLRWTGSSYNDPEGTYTFTRSEGGESIETLPDEIIYSYGSRAYRNCIQLLLLGYNTGNYTKEEYVLRVKRAKEFSLNGRCLIIGRHAASSKAAADTIIEEEALFKAEFGLMFLSSREYLVKYGLKEAGLEATEQDLEDIFNGIVPSSLRRDTAHFNNYGYSVFLNLVYRRLKELGYV